jgi:hypothetical protein
MRKNKSDFSVQANLPLITDKPILEYLMPVRIENWRMEGLFKRSRYSVGQKMRFVMHIRASAFDFSPKNWIELHNAGCGASRQEVAADKKFQALRKFNAVRDPFMREVMQHMIVAEKLLGARYIAKRLKKPWPQFVMDFNQGLDEMLDAAELNRDQSQK